MIGNLLTICIPSFNRFDSVKRTLNKLFSIESSLHFKVIVIDNASDLDYLKTLSEDNCFKNFLDDKRLEVHRNFTNIGMSANIMRCFEKEADGWLWIISDDDDVCDDAIIKIHTVLGGEESTNCSCIYFGRYDGVVVDVLLDGLPSFIDLNSRTVNNFYQSIFLSNTIYLMSDVKKYISYGYLNAGSFIPHFMMTVHILNEGFRVKYVNSTVVNYIKPEIGYSYSMVAGLGVGLPKHSILNLSDNYYRKFSKLFYPHNDFKVIVDLFFETKNNKPAFKYLSTYYMSYVRKVRSIPLYFTLTFFKLLAHHDKLFEAVLKVTCSLNARIANEVSEIKIRNDYKS